jgi:hypothetical protein
MRVEEPLKSVTRRTPVTWVLVAANVALFAGMALARQRAFDFSPHCLLTWGGGLGKGGWVPFESVNYPGCFLRHKDEELWAEKNDGSELFAKDATFRIVEPFYKP